MKIKCRFVKHQGTILVCSHFRYKGEIYTSANQISIEDFNQEICLETYRRHIKALHEFYIELKRS